MNNFQEKVSFIWSVADLLRGDYKQSEYGRVILPLTVMRRLDCVLEPKKEDVPDKAKGLPKKADEAMRDLMLCQAAGKGMTFYNTSKFVLQPTEVAKGKGFVSLLSDQDQIAANLSNYIAGFSANAREILIDKFKFGEQINRLDESNLLFLVLRKFTEIDLHPDAVDNIEMVYIFEELIRRFSEASNETAGEHFTPREVIRLMVNLLFVEDSDALTKKGVIRTLYDPACGTGGMLSVAENYLRELNPSATLKTYGQELNPESYAICKSDMLIKGEDASNIKFGNSFTQDGLPTDRFDYFLSNPPFGVEWKKVQKEITDEHEKMGMSGRFGAGLPRVSDGSLLFLLHMVSKFRHDGSGSRLAIVFNGSPLFTGSAGSGESEIRRWLIENDMLEAIVGMPDQLFYNTGISTYVWIVTNRKPKARKGKIQLIDASGEAFFVKMRKSLGNKRNEIGDGTNGKADQIAEITRIFGDFEEGPHSKIFDNEDFGYWRITVERPLRLNFVVDDERLERLKESKPFQGLATSRKKGAAGQKEIEVGQELQQQLLAALETLRNPPLSKNREEFTKRLKKAFKAADLTVPAPLMKVILSALGERDETADICTDSKGNPEPDSDLRDYENVPLKEEIQAYVEREVLPHVPDAWIGQIPAHWQVRSFRYCGVIPNGQVDPRLPQFREQTLVAPNHIESGTGRLLGTETADEQGAESGKYVFEAGNVLYSKIRPELAKVCLIDFHGLCSADMYPIAPRSDVNAGFLAYQMICKGFTESVVLASARVAMPKVNRDELGGISLVIPSLPEQQAIAAFLDRKTAQIDAVVAKKQRLIERLQEKRQALISHAVTKGLDTHASMKDSGIEWLGEIPAHWTLSKLSYVANIVRGASPRPAGDPLYFNGDAAPWITVAEVTKDSCKYLTSTSTCLTPEGQALSRLLRSGTLILTNSGATLGVPKIIQIDGCINDGSVAFLGIRRSVSKDYLYYFLSSLTQMLRERASGQGQPNLNTDIVKAIPFPFGSLEEQDRIVAFVEAESNRISNVMDALQNQISKLQEYRQTLISAAVTGKIDVTKEAAC